MVILIAGGTHTGKTLLAQRLLEERGYPYLSIDHLKMGLIRSGYTALTPESPDAALTAYLWPVVREMVKTALENRQNLVVEGCYIPFGYRRDFSPAELEQLRYLCLIFSEAYIDAHYDDIVGYEDVVERRLWPADLPAKRDLMAENQSNLLQCQEHGCDYILIDAEYRIDLPW